MMNMKWVVLTYSTRNLPTVYGPYSSSEEAATDAFRWNGVVQALFSPEDRNSKGDSQ